MDENWAHDQCRAYQCIQEIHHPGLQQRCRLIGIIHYLWAKIKTKSSYIRVILPNRIYVYMRTISEQTNFAQFLNDIYLIVLMKKYFETKFTYKYISIFHIFWDFWSITRISIWIISLLIFLFIFSYIFSTWNLYLNISKFFCVLTNPQSPPPHPLQISPIHIVRASGKCSDGVWWNNPHQTVLIKHSS